MALATKEASLNEFAQFVYTEQKDAFVEDFTHFIQKRIKAGEAQFNSGEFMSLDESKGSLYQEFFNV